VTNPNTGARARTHAGSNTTFFAEAWRFPQSGRGYLVALNEGGARSQATSSETMVALFQQVPPLPEPAE
jgi:hypothetical protein